MGDAKDKLKGFIKKVNNPFSSSGKFKGQGHVLGSSSSSSSATTATSNHSSNPLLPRASPAAAAVAAPSPVAPAPDADEREESGREGENEVVVGVAAFLSRGPPERTVEVALKLLGNVVREPGNVKFRRVRMSNPKIKEAIGDVEGGVELLECVGFRIVEEDDGELWGVMDEPLEVQVNFIKEAILILERRNGPDPKEDDKEETCGTTRDVVPPKKIDRQVRVFFLIPESVPERIELPDFFYNLSSEEIKREAEQRKKKLAESQLLIPKSYKEKQLKAARRRYKATLLRIQFPDGVLLQCVFLPWEPTTALYQFVSSSLKDPSLEFELIQPVPHKRRVIPQLASKSGGKLPTLEDEDLIPSALIKFKPMETDSCVFTGLRNELLVASEPLLPAASK